MPWCTPLPSDLHLSLSRSLFHLSVIRSHAEIHTDSPLFIIHPAAFPLFLYTFYVYVLKSSFNLSLTLLKYHSSPAFFSLSPSIRPHALSVVIISTGGICLSVFLPFLDIYGSMSLIYGQFGSLKIYQIKWPEGWEGGSFSIMGDRAAPKSPLWAESVIHDIIKQRQQLSD